MYKLVDNLQLILKSKNKLFMKTPILIIFLVIFFSCKENTKSNDIEILNTIAEPQNPLIEITVCGYDEPKKINIENLQFVEGDTRHLQIINQIVSYSGLSNNYIVIKEPGTMNAYAFMYEGKRFISYDPILFNDLEYYSDTYWSIISIFAHEIGHHLSGHSEDNIGSNPVSELEADYFTGFVLYKMGASLEQSLIAINLMGGEIDTETHPSKYKRIKKIEEGWLNANQLKFKAALPPSPEDNIKEFLIYGVNELVSKENIDLDTHGTWYGKYNFCFGIITDISYDENKVPIGFDVFVIREDNNEKEKSFTPTNEIVSIALETNQWSFDGMTKTHSFLLPKLLKPGRRIKFAAVEGYPMAGWAYKGIYYAIYLEALQPNYFDK